MKSSQRILLLASALLFVVSGCNKGIKMADGASLLSGGNIGLATDNSGGGTAVVNPSWDAIKSKVEGSVDGSAFDGQLMTQVDTANQALIVLLPIPFPALMMPVTAFDIPQLPGATVSQVMDANGGLSVAVKIPFKYIIKGANLAPYSTLPNGDPLPYMVGGDFHGFSVAFPQTPDIKLNLYLSANAAAAFIEIPALKLPEEWLTMTLGFPIKNAAKTETLGYMAFVPNKSTFNAGVYVVSRIPADLAIMIDEVIRY